MVVTALNSLHKNELNPLTARWGRYDYYPISHERDVGRNLRRRVAGRGGHEPRPPVASVCPQCSTPCLCYPKRGLRLRQQQRHPLGLGRNADSDPLDHSLHFNKISRSFSARTGAVLSDEKSASCLFPPALLGAEKETGNGTV